MSNKINITTLRKIISEEIATLKEGADHDTASKVMASAVKLIAAIESFKESATGKAKAETSSHLDALENVLKNVINSPMNYVDVPKRVAKKVSLKPTGKVM
jgi:hypothetical protein